ncbi:hypothetical protein A9Q84_19635 [Halobacteriovorax marinus]|uniref:Transglycosylase SLT domain-containing protein n=1 Tax=Halobacteriovorax marinus TaxID=97084 RepID=A0A1Y5F814_9BACT|nr:hypothetical protein A9Q84_19635 [Halobacteriovorax marinus]
MENKRILSYLVIISLSTSCATKLLRAPKKGFLNLTGKVKLEEPEILANKYHRANLELKEGFNQLACEKFEELSLIENFPLRKISHIKALKSCDWTADKLISTWNEAKIPKWLQEEYFESSLSIAKKKNIKLWQSKHNFSLYPFQKRKDEKEKFIHRALKIAEDEQFSEQIVIYNEELKKISPRYITAPTSEELYSVARDYERARNFKQAISTYEEILKSKDIEPDTKIKSWHRITRVFKNQRRRDLALSSTHTLVKWITKNKVIFSDKYQQELVEARLRWARATWTANNLKLAKKILKNTLKKFKPTDVQTSTVHYLLGNISKEEKKIKKAIKSLYLSLSFADSEQRELVLWQLAWLEYKRKNYSVSSKLFLDLHVEFDNTSKYSYWLGKSLSREKKSEESIKFFEKTSEIAPFGYYGIQAKKLLGLKLEIVKNTISSSEDRLFEWLIALGEFDISKNYLNSFIYSSSGENEKLSLLGKMNQSKNFRGSLRTYFNMSEEQREDVSKQYIHYIYPKPNLATKFIKSDYDADLAYSIIRQESAFDKDARSFADAYGLMQIIPKRAVKLAKRHRVPYRNEKDLYDIDTNIVLGVRYLEDLKKSFKNLPMAIGSYNAGENAMHRWRKSRFNGDMEIFIEDIPYRETRKYIKLVLRNYSIYQQLPISEKVFIY